MRFRDYKSNIAIIILAIFAVNVYAQDLLDDESEAASEGLLLDAALDGDLLGGDLDLDSDDLELSLDDPSGDLLADDLAEDMDLGGLEEEPDASELDLGDLDAPLTDSDPMGDDILAEETIDEPMDDPLAEEADPLATEPMLEDSLDEPMDDVLAEEADPLAEEPMVEDLAIEEPMVEDLAIEEPMLEDDPLAVDNPVVDEPIEVAEEMPVEEPEPADSMVEETEIDFNALVSETLDDRKQFTQADQQDIPSVKSQVSMQAAADDDLMSAALMEAVQTGIPPAPVVTGVRFKELEDLEFAENLAILKRQAGEQHAVQQLEEGAELYRTGEYESAITRYKYAYTNLGRRESTRRARAAAKMGIAKCHYGQALRLYKSDEIEAALESARAARDYGHPKAIELIKLVQAPKVAEVKETKFVRTPVLEVEKVKRKIQSASDMMWLGRQRYQSREYDQAQEAFEAALKIEPQNTEAIRMLRKIGKLKFDRGTLELESTREMMMGDLRRTWNPRHYRELDEVSRKLNVSPGQNTRVDQERDIVIRKMQDIVIPEIDFRQANINDVIEFLAGMSTEFDNSDVEAGGMRGVNIILNLGTTPGAAPEPALDDMGFGDEGAAAPAAALSDIPLVTFTARELTLLEALKIVTEYCNLKFSVRGSMVMIVRKDYTFDEIMHRWYPVMNFTDIIAEAAANTVAAGGGGGRQGGDEFIQLDSEGVGGGGASGDWRGFFEGLGVPWPQGTSIKYLPAIGKLLVANTAENLALFEQILDQFDFVPKQIEIEARFVEVNQDDLDALGFEWGLTDDWEMLTRKNDGHLPIASRPQIKMPANTASGGFTQGNRFLTDGVGDAGIPIADSVMKIASVLTNPELDFVLHMMKQKGNSDLLSAPKVTAQSGSEATIKVVEEYIYPTEFTVSGVAGANNAAGGGGGGMSGAVVEPGGFETREVGVLLSVLPEVSAEGQMIMLQMNPEVCEFVRWEEFGSTFSDGQGNLQQLRMPQPIFHTRNVTTQIMIFNGATVVMGGMITERRTSVSDKVPILGDIPLIGRLFQSKYDQSEKRNLLVFVTARMVTPDGRPVKTAEEMNPMQEKGETAMAETK